MDENEVQESKDILFDYNSRIKYDLSLNSEINDMADYMNECNGTMIRSDEVEAFKEKNIQDIELSLQSFLESQELFGNLEKVHHY